MPGIHRQSSSANDTLATLVENLEPVRRRGRTGSLAAGWLGVGWVGVVVATLTLGPLRPDALAQIVGSPQFLLENLLGLASGTVLASVGFLLCIPGGQRKRMARSAWALFGLWVASYVYALWEPALATSMLGKRAGCALQVLGLGLVLLTGALLAARRLAPLHPVWSGGLLGAAAGALPGLFMQLACMYDPAHTLTYHVAPIVVLAIVGAGAARRVLPAV